MLQQRAFTPTEFPSLPVLKESSLGFKQYYEKIAIPFEGKISPKNFNPILCRMEEHAS